MSVEDVPQNGVSPARDNETTLLLQLNTPVSWRRDNDVACGSRCRTDDQETVVHTLPCLTDARVVFGGRCVFVPEIPGVFVKEGAYDRLIEGVAKRALEATKRAKVCKCHGVGRNR